MRKYAIFVACTPNYMKHVNSLLNSIEKRSIRDLDFYVFHYGGVNDAWIKDIQTAFSFTVKTEEIKRSEVPEGSRAKDSEFVKRARFFYLRKYASAYQACCLLDADMFIVSEQLAVLFDLVAGTDALIGCNEGFKWPSNNYCNENGKPILDCPTRLYKMHCSVPIIFDYARWKDVFDYYCQICFKYKMKRGENLVGIGDIYAWNISVYKCNMQNKVTLFPMETMCQVHKKYMHPSTFPIVENGYWFTNSGDPIYSIQGRWNTNQDFVDSSMKWCKENMFDKIGRNDFKAVSGKIRKGLESIQQEWYDLNFNGKTNLDKYEQNKYTVFNRKG